jgi:multidrug efflux pump
VGIRLFMQPVQDLTIEDRVSRTQYQFSLVAGRRAAGAVERQAGAGPAAAPGAGRRGQRPAGQGPAGVPGDRPRHGQPPGHQRVADHQRLYDAFGQRQISTIYTQASQYRVVLQSQTAASLGPQALESIHVKATDGGQVRLSALARIEQRQAQLAISTSASSRR